MKKNQTKVSKLLEIFLEPTEKGYRHRAKTGELVIRLKECKKKLFYLMDFSIYNPIGLHHESAFSCDYCFGVGFMLQKVQR